MRESVTRFLGYDPGGASDHGVAELDVDLTTGRVLGATTARVATADAACAHFRATMTATAVAGIGVDTLTEWCLGHAGWRPADAWLRQRYPQVQASVDNPNHINGAMSLNGMGVLTLLRQASPALVVTEAHPKVLYFALAQAKYDWSTSRPQMVQWLSSQLGTVALGVSSDHEFDALLSAWACVQGVLGRWSTDLHAPIAGFAPSGTILQPAGPTRYFWP